MSNMDVYEIKTGRDKALIGIKDGVLYVEARSFGIPAILAHTTKGAIMSGQNAQSCSLFCPFDEIAEAVPELKTNDFKDKLLKALGTARFVEEEEEEFNGQNP